jgi:putative two-component system response regulator
MPLSDRFPRDPCILVVDDEDMNIQLLRHVLEPAGFTRLVTATDPRSVMPLFRAARPDLVLLDLKLPHLDGYHLLDLLRAEIPPDDYLPILVLTSDASADARRRALAGGAQDFLAKPLSPMEIRLRVGNLLETRFLHLALRDENERLEERVRQRTAELEEARIEILERLARAAEFRDDATGLHTQRVGRIAALLAETVGLSGQEVELIRRAAPLHDIGKIGIPDAVLLKDARLTADEIAVMQNHTRIGAEILSGSDVPLLALGREIALTHHERWDGSGYPGGLMGVTIPLSGRAVAVADVFDALTHERPYKRAWTPAEALAEIERQAGSQFDPDLARAFAQLYQAGRLAESIAAVGRSGGQAH